MSSLPNSYQPTLQMITAAERASKLSGGQSQQIKPDDLIAFIIKEAQHCVISNKHSKNAESALAAHGKKGKEKGRKKKKQDKSSKTDSDEVCDSCKRSGHVKADCWSKGGGKEGQGLRQKKSKREEKFKSAVVAVDKDGLLPLLVPLTIPMLLKHSRFRSQNLILVSIVKPAGTAVLIA